LDDQPDLPECWNWFTRVERTLGYRLRMADYIRSSLHEVSAEDKADLLTSVEFLIVEIDRDALMADRLGAALLDREATEALQRVSAKLDRLTNELGNILLDQASTTQLDRWSQGATP
jgi:hypothetical protein